MTMQVVRQELEILVGKTEILAGTIKNLLSQTEKLGQEMARSVIMTVAEVERSVGGMDAHELNAYYLGTGIGVQALIDAARKCGAGIECKKSDGGTLVSAVVNGTDYHLETKMVVR